MIQHKTLTQLKLESVLLQRIIDAQRTDKGMKHIHEKIEADKANCFRKDDQGIIWFNNRICWGPSASEGPQKHDLTMFLEYNT
jgi:hypothetical protein